MPANTPRRTTRQPATTPAVELNVEPYEFHTADGESHRIASFGAFHAGDIRRVRHLDEVSQMFTLAELAAESDESDEDVLDAIDGMSLTEIGDFFTGWQSAAGVALPN